MCVSHYILHTHFVFHIPYSTYIMHVYIYIVFVSVSVSASASISYVFLTGLIIGSSLCSVFSHLFFFCSSQPYSHWSQHCVIHQRWPVPAIILNALLKLRCRPMTLPSLFRGSQPTRGNASMYVCIYIYTYVCI